jgi:hypothetical protein
VLAGASPAALAHQPSFPEGAGPFPVHDPVTSQAYYLQLPAKGSLVFVVDPIPRPVPVQVLVLDDDAGRALDLVAQWSCGNRGRGLARVDMPFYEQFSRLHMRYRVADSVGPTDGPCTVRITEAAGRGGPLAFAIGSGESFSFAGLWTLLTLRDKLETWKRGD